MELENIRKSWEIHTSAKESEFIVSKSTVENLLNRRAENSRKKIIKLMGIDAVVMIFVNSGFIALLYYLQLSSKHIGALIITLATLVLFIHYHLSVLLIQRTNANVSVSKGISQTINYIKRYFLIYKTVFPSLLFAFLFASFQMGMISLQDLFSLSSNVWVEATEAIFVAITSFLILHIVIRLLYQKDVKNLAILLKELEE